MMLRCGSLLVAAAALASSAAGQSELLRPVQDFYFEEQPDGSIVAADGRGTYWFASYAAYAGSPFFEEHGLHCGQERLPHPIALGTSSDCSSSNTSIEAQYHPSSGPDYLIPVVFHVIQRTDGTGFISDALLQTQIDVLNEDFGAFGSGSLGTNTRIQFMLAGITRSTNNFWYDDNGSYWDSLAWDTTQYLNLYTNSADGFLGYAFIPSGGGLVGNTYDRVVCYWASIGRPGPIGPPYDLGRTATHEVGHYLGLYHTFQGGCSGTSGCFNNGDLICDTLPESGPNFSPCVRSTCGDADPTDNYLDYSDDVCMTKFTLHQAHRMRCTLENFRVDLAEVSAPNPATNPSPAHGASDVDVAPLLTWTAGAGTVEHAIYFGTDPTPEMDEFQGLKPSPSFAPGNLANGTTYYWRVDEVNGVGTTVGAVWSFTTEGLPAPPAPAVDPRPVDGAVNVPWKANLAWTAGSGATSHDVYFGTSNPPPFVGNQAGTSFDPGSMQRLQTYYWRIDEVNAAGTTAGVVWSFTTSHNLRGRGL